MLMEEKNLLEQNKAVVRRYWDEIWNNKKKERIEELVAPNHTIHFPSGMAHQIQSVQEWVETAFIAFPNVHFTTKELIAERDLVSCRWTYTATHQGEFIGYPPTGKDVKDSGMEFFRIENGKIAEIWVNQDSLGLLQQLGIIPTPAQENKAIVHRFFQGAWNDFDLSLADQYIAPDSIDHSPLPGHPPTGPESFKAIINMFHNGLSNLHMNTDDEIAEGDRVVHRWTLRGTNTGELFGVPPTSKEIVMTGTTVVRVVDGKIVERWTNLDELGLLRQLGVIPPAP